MEFWLLFVMLTVYTIFIPMENARVKIIFDESDGTIVWSPWNQNGCNHGAEVSNRYWLFLIAWQQQGFTHHFVQFLRLHFFVPRYFWGRIQVLHWFLRSSWTETNQAESLDCRKTHDRASGSCHGPVDWLVSLHELLARRQLIEWKTSPNSMGDLLKNMFNPEKTSIKQAPCPPCSLIYNSSSALSSSSFPHRTASRSLVESLRSE